MPRLEAINCKYSVKQIAMNSSVTFYRFLETVYISMIMELDRVESEKYDIRYTRRTLDC